MMDALDGLLELAQVTGCVDIQCLLGERWYVRHERARCEAWVHIVTSGEGYLHADGMEPRLLRAGDVVFLPRGLGHVLSHDVEGSGQGCTVELGRNGAFTVERCGSGVDMNLFCARFAYDVHSDLMRGLPEVVFLNVGHPSLRALVEMLQYESRRAMTGAVSVVNALSSVLLVLLIRACLDNGEMRLDGVLGGWQDRRLGAVVRGVVDRPEDDWSVGRMVALANLSRAQLMRRFRECVGITPHAFVNRIRLQKGAVLLRRTSDSVLAVALSVGFQSETHFGKAFRRLYGVSPGQYRKMGRVE